MGSIKPAIKEEIQEKKLLIYYFKIQPNHSATTDCQTLRLCRESLICEKEERGLSFIFAIPNYEGALNLVVGCSDRPK